MKGFRREVDERKKRRGRKKREMKMKQQLEN